jgi:hypothetical protein
MNVIEATSSSSLTVIDPRFVTIEVSLKDVELCEEAHLPIRHVARA